jgi:hypothetical protein
MPRVERLRDQGYATLVLRLLVDRQSREVVHGEVGGLAEEAEEMQRWIHFHGSAGLLEAVQKWLTAVADDQL